MPQAVLTEPRTDRLGDQHGIRATVSRLLRESTVGMAAHSTKPYLAELKARAPKVEQRIAEFDDFRRTGRLPVARTGVDDGLGTLR